MTSPFLPDIVYAPPPPMPLFIKVMRVIILIGVWTLVGLAAFASWLATAS